YRECRALYSAIGVWRRIFALERKMPPHEGDAPPPTQLVARKGRVLALTAQCAGRDLPAVMGIEDADIGCTAHHQLATTGLKAPQSTAQYACGCARQHFQRAHQTRAFF